MEIPRFIDLRTIASIVTCEANGEAFLAPLNPRSPADVQAKTFPRPSEHDAITLFSPIEMRSSNGERFRRGAAIANFNNFSLRSEEADDHLGDLRAIAPYAKMHLSVQTKWKSGFRRSLRVKVK
ncbi:MAG: hypothetical protein ACTS68_01440 [Candidatus Hodgkinia cicadicola]